MIMQDYKNHKPTDEESALRKVLEALAFTGFVILFAVTLAIWSM